MPVGNAGYPAIVRESWVRLLRFRRAQYARAGVAAHAPAGRSGRGAVAAPRGVRAPPRAHLHWDLRAGRGRARAVAPPRAAEAGVQAPATRAEKPLSTQSGGYSCVTCSPALIIVNATAALP